MRKFLVYLLILLIPVQLGRHFFFDFSRIAGIYSDYLTPVFYLTDIVILYLIYKDLRENKLKINPLLFTFFVYLFFSVIFIAENKWVAFYKLFKLAEFVWLFRLICLSGVEIRQIFRIYSLAVLYSSFLAIAQFINQKSIGGIWWYLGERSFYSTTPGIALGTFYDKLFLRPYATFAHPNVLGGFLALGLPFIFYFLIRKKTLPQMDRIIYFSSCIVGTIALILAYSRAAWFIFVLGLMMINIADIEKMQKFVLKSRTVVFFIIILLFILSAVVPILAYQVKDPKRGSLFERKILIDGSVAVLRQNPLFGAGLNNSIIEQYRIMPKNYGLFTTQPVHNIFLLTIAELGLVGLLFLLIFLSNIFKKLNDNNVRQFIMFCLMIVLGLFDHYLLTLQQGMMILVLFTSLVNLNKT